MKFRIILVSILLWSSALFAQDYLDVIRPFTGMPGSSGAVSRVSLASGNANNALLGNPALLSYSERAYFATDFSFDQVKGSSVFNSDINLTPQEDGLLFNSLSYIYPVNVYRGAWVWGFNIQPVNSFSRINRFASIDPDGEFHYQYANIEKGSLYALTAASSFMYTKNTSLGLAMSYLTGQNTASEVYYETDPEDIYEFDTYMDSLYFSPEYSGFSARFGFMSELSEFVRVGGSVELPARVSVKESSGTDTSETFDDGLGNYSSSDSYTGLEYSVWGPWRFGVGVGFTAAQIDISVNYKLHRYAGTSFSGDVIDPFSGKNLEAVIDKQIKDNVQNVHEFSTSMVLSLNPLTFSFAAAFMNEPLNYNLNNRIHIQTGVAYQISPSIGLSMALQNEQWRTDLNHEIESGALRIVDVENSFTRLQFGLKYIL